MRSPSSFVFDLNSMLRLAEQHAQYYEKAQPFKHVVLDNFLPEDVAEYALEKFPGVDSPVFLDRSMRTQPGKYGTVNGHQISKADPWLQQLLFAFNSYGMLAFLEKLTGIKNLISDPYYYGGGLHQIVGGGHLDVHADFNYQKEIGLFRRINVLLYLNKNWQTEYGGQLELWQENPMRCVKRIEPIFNRCVIFNTSQHSLHGHPAPLKLSRGETRKSIALYYYTRNPAPGDEAPRETLWKSIS